MSLKLKIGMAMAVVLLLFGVIGAFVDSLTSGFVYIGTLAYMTVMFWLMIRG